MIVKSYNNIKNKGLYYRYTLNKKDKLLISSEEVKIYKLKCIGATQEIFNLKHELETENLEFNDRFFPRKYVYYGKISKAEFKIVLNHKEKKRYFLIFEIDFYPGGKIKIKDSYAFANPFTIQEKYSLPHAEYKLYYELETIVRKLIHITKNSDLCNTCPFYPEYQVNGYCLNYHPDSKIP